MSRESKLPKLKIAALVFDTSDKPRIAVVDVTARPPELNAKERQRLFAKLVAEHKLTSNELFFLRAVLLVPPPKKAGRPPRQQAQFLEIARCYIRLLACDSTRKKLDAEVAVLFSCKKRTVRSAIASARELDGGEWWRAAEHTAEHDPRRGVWKLAKA